MKGLRFFVKEKSEIVEALTEQYQVCKQDDNPRFFSFTTKIMIKWLSTNRVTEVHVGFLDYVATDGDYELWNNA